MKRLGGSLIVILAGLVLVTGPAWPACDALNVRNYTLRTADSDTLPGDPSHVVVGTAVNTSSDTFNFAEVVFSFTNSSAASDYEAWDMTFDLAARATWNFEAEVWRDRPGEPELKYTNCSKHPDLS